MADPLTLMLPTPATTAPAITAPAIGTLPFSLPKPGIAAPSGSTPGATTLGAATLGAPSLSASMRAAPTNGTGLTMSAIAPAAHHSAFHELLSELNPLQYVPIVGTIYRAVTGDTIPQTVREFGSLAVSGLVGGPIGVATNIACLAIEKVTGIDPEEIGQTILERLGIGHATGPNAAAAPATHPAAAVPAAAAVAASAAPTHAVAWSASQLTAYGVTRTADGGLKRGDVTGADVLNDLELARHQPQPAGA